MPTPAADLRLTGKLDLALSGRLGRARQRHRPARRPARSRLRRARPPRARRARRPGLPAHPAQPRRPRRRAHRVDSIAAARDLSANGTAPTFAMHRRGGAHDARRAPRPPLPRAARRLGLRPLRAWNGDFQATLKPNIAARLPALWLGGAVAVAARRLLPLRGAPGGGRRQRPAVAPARRGRCSPSAARTATRRRGRMRRNGGTTPGPTAPSSTSKLARSLTFSLRASRDDYTSSLPGFDRSVNSVQTGLTFDLQPPAVAVRRRRPLVAVPIGLAVAIAAAVVARIRRMRSLAWPIVVVYCFSTCCRRRPRPTGDRSEYRIGPKDLLQIGVYEVPELNVRQRVSENGTISLPLIGEIKVAGYTQSQLAAELKRLLEEELRRAGDGHRRAGRAALAADLRPRRGHPAGRPRLLRPVDAARGDRRRRRAGREPRRRHPHPAPRRQRPHRPDHHQRRRPARRRPTPR